MSELYAKLLAEARTAYEVWARQRMALVAALELHKPYESRHWGICCQCCSNPEDDDPVFGEYPCETVRVIAEALGVTG